ncbi:MAG: bacteriohemerythrin [Defluviitaleaceae bacterium]|nr:bacteriohemerythrin [Defluviitaleaceae bacterium]
MWRDEFLMGVPHIDAQHRSLFGKAGELADLISQGVDSNREAIIGVIEFLKNYAITHFADEEKYQEETNYENIESHKLQHKAFIKTFLTHEKRLIDSGFSEAEVKHAANSLTEWLIHHVSNLDLRIVGKKPLDRD